MKPELVMNLIQRRTPTVIVLVAAILLLIITQLPQTRAKFSNNFLFRHIQNQREQVKKKSLAVHLNYLMPTFAGVIDSQGAVLGGQGYIDYFEKVREFRPSRADAHGLLGVAYFHRGDLEKSIESFQKAIQLEPGFFYFFYDLGIVYYQEEQYPQAAAAFQKAVAVKPEMSLKFLYSSKLYADLIRAAGLLESSIVETLKEDYQKCLLFLVLSSNPFHRLKNKKLIESMTIRFF